jgi:hypothetical protein
MAYLTVMAATRRWTGDVLAGRVEDTGGCQHTTLLDPQDTWITRETKVDDDISKHPPIGTGSRGASSFRNTRTRRNTIHGKLTPVIVGTCSIARGNLGDSLDTRNNTSGEH